MNRVAIALFAFAAATFFSACDKSPTGPTPPSGPTPPAGPPVVRTISIEGPAVLNLGDIGEFTVTAHLTDGSSRDVTAEASWSSFFAILQIASPGRVRGNISGEASVAVQFAERYAYRTVMVLPRGTYRLTGRVTEALAISGPVVGALVEVTTAGGVRLSAHTDEQGNYRAYGVANETSVRVVKDGYQSVTQSIGVAADHTEHDIALALLAPRADVAGDYTLTITAASECGIGLGQGRLPIEAQVRTYQAAVRQEGPALQVTLTGPTLPDARWGFTGRVEPRGVAFDLRWQDGYEPVIVEALPTSNVFIIQGMAMTTGTVNRLVGSLSGEFRVLDTWNVWASTPPAASCTSANHQFVLAR
jgi:hypothetical protein